METYAENFFNNYLKKHNKSDFTHKDLLIHTDANCPYSVLRCLKSLLALKGLKITEKTEETINIKNQKKRYKRYYIEVI